ncbi:uncharacterized protein LOC113862377 [Abrus precatorius]|uniref:Uncharacterized protein LOC113862377 n=1 Tax=Abrus precatorius TaxID=3816 RepID=A0A8B8L4Y1_ABRPR|nr:uncharacterized protein LOC113862377 [Abrus precatorius]
MVEKSELPEDVFDIISKKLDFDDLFQFGGVCKSWRIFHKSYLRDLMASQEPLVVQTSFLMQAYSFFSIPEQKVYGSVRNCYLSEFFYSGSSCGYVIMVGISNNKLLLMNPFVRRKVEINMSALNGNIEYLGCNALFAFAKGSEEFIVVVSGKYFQCLHIYESRNSCWVTCSAQGEPWTVVDFVVFDNTIYAITNKGEIGVLRLNSPTLKFLKLKNIPKIIGLILKLVSCDGQLLVVNFASMERLDVYKIDFSTMGYVKMETMGDIALFFGWTKCYALSNPSRWGYDSNSLYFVNRSTAGGSVYSEDMKPKKSILPSRPPPSDLRSSLHWLDWCFKRHDQVDYSVVH